MQLGQSGLGEPSRKLLVEVVPPVLVVHLKRFVYDASANGMVKIKKPVQFAPELEIPPGTVFCFVFLVLAKTKNSCISVDPEIMVPMSEKPAEPVHYRLHGVLYHHGESPGSGNYTVDVLHQNEDGGCGEAWLHIDDEVVRAVRDEDVFGAHENEQADNKCSYMLLYCRAASTQTR